jgi:hypothetical protein
MNLPVPEFFLTILNGLFALIAGSIAGLLTAWLSRKQKTLDLQYHVVYDARELFVENIDAKKVKVLNEGKHASGFRLVSLRIRNSGYTAIDPDDFVKDLTISFGANSKIVNADIAEKVPKNLKVKLHIVDDENKLLIEPLLLNRKDLIILNMLVQGYKQGEIAFEGLRESTAMKVRVASRSIFRQGNSNDPLSLEGHL